VCQQTGFDMSDPAQLETVRRQFVLKSRPTGVPKPDDFEMVSTPVPDLEPGTFIVRNAVIGLAPATRLRLGGESSYMAPTPLGSVIYSQSAGVVVASAHAGFALGENVALMDGGWQTHARSDGSNARKIDPTVAPPSVWLGALGVSGFAAYAGLKAVAGLRPSETVVVSAAAGAVGAAAGQIAKIAGCRIIGIAGGGRKVDFVRATLGFDAALDYRSSTFRDDLRAACGDGGVNVYFDNVGGRVTDAVLGVMSDFGRVAVCGQISAYNATGSAGGPDWMPVLTKRLTVRGFMIQDHQDLQDDFIRDLSVWIRNGSFKVVEDVIEGFENLPAAFIGMLTGANLGKTLVRLEEG
jgi:NADPH-dependent curcumin reductase CurA